MLCAVPVVHFKVRRVSVAGYTTDETLEWKPEERTGWRQRYIWHM